MATSYATWALRGQQQASSGRYSQHAVETSSLSNHETPTTSIIHHRSMFFTMTNEGKSIENRKTSPNNPKKTEMIEQKNYTLKGWHHRSRDHLRTHPAHFLETYTLV